MKRLLCALVPLAVAMTGCAGPRAIGGAPTITVVDAAVLPAPAGIDLSSELRPYRVGPFDELLVDVYGFTELDERKISVDGTGRIAIPIVGEITVAGLGLSEVQRMVEDRLRERYVREPVVAINVSEVRSQLVSVDGQVGQPGRYPVLGRTSLMAVVAQAKGTTEFARLRDVVVFRTVGDQRMVAMYNLDAIRRGAYADPEIFADDVVVVGDTPSRRWLQSALQAGTILVGPLVAILQNR